MKYALMIVVLCIETGILAEDGRIASTAHLASPPIISGLFVQEKRIVGLKRPLLSSGDFLVVRDQGVIWRIEKPFATAVVVTPTGIWSLEKNGADISRQAIHQGNMDLAMDMIQKVLAGDPTALTTIFTVTESGTTEKWAMELKPLDPVIAKVILTIRLEGSAYVDAVDYAETNGDKTHISFSAVKPALGELGSWRIAAFHD